MKIFPLGVLVAVIAAVVFVIRTEDPGNRSRSLKQVALALVGTFSLIMTLFVAGETFTDPGGWEAVGLVAMWLAPIVGLGSLAWFRPALATIVFAVLIAGMFALFVWSAIAPDAWSEFEDAVGPVRAIAAFAIAAPLTLLGWKRPREASVMLLSMMVPPAIVAASGGEAVGASILFAVSPSAVAGILLLLASKFEQRADHGPPATVGDGGSLSRAA